LSISQPQALVFEEVVLVEGREQHDWQSNEDCIHIRVDKNHDLKKNHIFLFK